MTINTDISSIHKSGRYQGDYEVWCYDYTGTGGHGKVKFAGKVPGKEEIKSMLK